MTHHPALVGPLNPMSRRARIAVVVARGSGPDEGRPWELLPIAGTPLLTRLLQRLEARGVRQIILHCLRRGDLYRSVVGRGTQLGLNVQHSSGPLPHGLDGLLSNSSERSSAERPVLLQPADVLVWEGPAGVSVDRLSSWSDLRRLVERVLGDGSQTSSGVPGDGPRGSFVAPGAVVEDTARLTSSAVERGSTVCRGATLENVVVLPGSFVPSDAILRHGVVDGARWMPTQPDSVASLPSPLRSLRSAGPDPLSGLGSLLRRPARWALGLGRSQSLGVVSASDHDVLRPPRVLNRAVARQLTAYGVGSKPLLALDLSDCEGADQYGLAAIEELLERCQELDVRLFGFDPTPRLRDQLEAGGWEHRLALFSDLSRGLGQMRSTTRRVTC